MMFRIFDISSLSVLRNLVEKRPREQLEEFISDMTCVSVLGLTARRRTDYIAKD